ncbi:RNA polymerase sigma factor [Kineococcus indalonis]|uniref:RNA polymerase sigma factor n=1 Tax=Kineococcus indalonis TaxID=2696566 RepID=UPI001412ADEF|nr:sigma-70 family RNA polymerase sigma factor [Kineococcus indalonis]NAZ85148.1 sigma-70 family RNA polymerase sigma factor [Kineococcus indalonis]
MGVDPVENAQDAQDAQAFAALFARQHHLVRAFAARRVGHVEAEEVTSEVFLRAWQHWPLSGQRGPGWLYRTAADVVAEHLRSRAHRDHVVQHLQRVVSAVAHDGAHHGGQGQGAEVRIEQAAAAAALLQLSGADREILLALSWDGLSTPEPAQVLGCSVAAAHVRVHRARRRLAALSGAARAEDPRAATAPPAPPDPPAAREPTTLEPPAGTARRARRAGAVCGPGAVPGAVPDAQEELR